MRVIWWSTVLLFSVVLFGCAPAAAPAAPTSAPAAAKPAAPAGAPTAAAGAPQNY